MKIILLLVLQDIYIYKRNGCDMSKAVTSGLLMDKMKINNLNNFKYQLIKMVKGQMKQYCKIKIIIF